MAVAGGALTEAASSTAQAASRPASSGTVRRGAVTPVSGPTRSTASPEPISTASDAHGT